jgi:hypothetical protein
MSTGTRETGTFLATSLSGGGVKCRSILGLHVREWVGSLEPVVLSVCDSDVSE